MNKNFFKNYYFLFALFFYFYNLNWGSPYYFHPDERNIASSISQLRFPDNLNPHFFAYGSLPIYIAYIIGVFLNFFSNPFLINFKVGFDEAIFITRIISAIFSALTVLLIFKVTKELKNEFAAKISLILSSLSVAYLQFSHFGTFEMWLSFFSLLLFYFFFLFLKTQRKIFFVLGSIVFGVIVGIKISSLVLVVLPLFSIGLLKINKRYQLKKSIEIMKLLFILFFFSILSYAITSPFNLIDFKSFANSIKYEGGVASGSLPVFYTGAFFNTLPIIFQYVKVLPFLVNPLLTLISIIAIIYSVFIAIKKRDKILSFIIISFLVIFVSQSFLFAKWVRYIIPSLSFLYIVIAIFINDLKKIIPKKIFSILLIILIFLSLIFSLSFIKTTMINLDTRSEALKYAEKNIPSNSKIISETYDLGILPFNSFYPNIILFNFYDLDSNTYADEKLKGLLKSSDFIILPSQRVLKSRTENNTVFPKGFAFYKNLFEGSLGFKKIYETSCDIFCKITYMGNPVFNVEETSNVFDRPTIFIFKKND